MVCMLFTMVKTARKAEDPFTIIYSDKGWRKMQARGNYDQITETIKKT